MEKKIAVITGARSEIGKAIAHLLAKQEMKLALLVHTQEAKEEVRKVFFPSSDIYIYVCDITNTQNVTHTFLEIAENFSSIDYLVNDAGWSSHSDLSELTSEQFDMELRINLTGTYNCIMAAYQIMNPNGAIVNISSIRGITGTPSSSPGYAAAKAGVINLTKSFALQLAAKQIRVNTVSPGAIYPTNMSKDWDEKTKNNIITATPLHRIGTPEDIAYIVSFLLSDQSSFITGENIAVDGGRVLLY